MNPDEILNWAKKNPLSEVNDTIAKYADDLAPGAGFNMRIDMRSFLRHHGVNMGKSKIEYSLQDWHRGYKPEEVKKVLSYLDSPIHKLYVLIATEAGFRASTILALKYKHISEDLEANITPCAIRLEPKFYQGKKAAGVAFLGQRSLTLLKECIKNKQVSTEPDAFIFAGRSAGEPSSYAAFYDAISLARKKAGIDPKVQPNHGLRKFFENALDQSGIDQSYKMQIEGHFIGARGKHYSSREWDTLRPVYQQAYPFLDSEGFEPELGKKMASWETEKLAMQAQIDKLTTQLTATNAAVQLMKMIQNKERIEREQARKKQKGS